MILRDVSGRTVEIIPAHRNHVFVEPIRSEGVSPSGIFLSQHPDYPVTEGVIREVPQDTSEIHKLYPEGLQIGDHVVYSRYATDEGHCFEHYDWETQLVARIDGEIPVTITVVEEDDPRLEIKEEEVFAARNIYALNVHDIQCVVGQLQPV